MAKKSHIEAIEDITEGCEKRCILKVMALRWLDDRTLEQMKCIGYYMDEMQKKDDRKYTWTEINRKWIDEGHAERFAGVYEEYEDCRLKSKSLYRLIIGYEPAEINFNEFGKH